MAYASFDLKFNSSCINYSACNPTSQIGSGSGTVAADIVPPGLLRVVIDYSSYAFGHFVNGNPDNGVNGSGYLCTLNFSAIAAGTSPLYFVAGQGTPPGELTIERWDNSSGTLNVSQIHMNPPYWINGSITVVK